MRHMLRFTLLLLLLLNLSCRRAFAQTDASALLAQLHQAVAGSATVHSVTLSGTATYYIAGKQDSGTAELTADLTGMVSMQASLAQLGSKTEQVPSGPGSDCTWSGSDEVVHHQSGLVCWRPVAWFFPALSLQPGSLLSSVGAVDLGTGTFAGGTYRHLQSQLVLSTLDYPLAQVLMANSTTDIGLDTTTLLPTVVAYTVRPDSGAAQYIAIQVNFSKYQIISGVQVPFHIERRINGALQASFDVTTATIN